MSTQPLTFTTSVPHGKVSPKRRATAPETKKRVGVPTMAPNTTSAPSATNSASVIPWSSKSAGKVSRSPRPGSNGEPLLALATPARFVRWAEDDALVSALRHLDDGVDVLGRAAVVGAVSAPALLVAGHVGVVAGDPRLGLAHQHHGLRLGDVARPASLGPARRLGALQAVRPHVLQELGAPVDPGLDAARVFGRGRA